MNRKLAVNLKKTVVIVILAVLMLAAFSMLLSPSVRAQSSEVKVLSYSWYVAPLNTVLAEWAGDLVAVGEVQNVGSNIIGNAFVVGFAYNSSGGFLDSSESQTYSTDLLPGQKAPFYIDFTPENSPTGDQSWVPSVTNVTVEVGYVSDTNATQYSGLTPTVNSASNVDGAFTVTGTVRNTGSETTGNVWVDTTFYNASGSVVALNYTNYLDLSGSLAPGESVLFTATPTDNTAQLSSEITNYSLLIQSDTLTTSTSPSPSPSPSATPTSSPTVSPVSVTSSGSSGLILAIVGAVVIVVVAVTALAFQRKRHNPPPPPPPPPPE